MGSSPQPTDPPGGRPAGQAAGRSAGPPASPSPTPVDELDARIVRLFAAEPRIGVLEASRRLGVARGTVQARLDRLARTGVVRGWGPEVEPAALGYGVTAFASLELRQGAGHEAVARHLAGIPEVLEAHTITGPADMLARLVARSNADLQRVIDEVLAFDGIVRISTVIALATQVRPRVVPLLSRAAESASD
ncbi:Lrp/AsnC family transcriptional regulator [Actinopolymorpha sp. NPDC004070]|uniref:Lrp/AsnC family transcriptional regulator n=1 Tax=Actinopolymorpha sp. NPDC004070 TaxID=3154548 RepID=UPI0033A6E55F